MYFLCLSFPLGPFVPFFIHTYIYLHKSPCLSPVFNQSIDCPPISISIDRSSRFFTSKCLLMNSTSIWRAISSYRCLPAHQLFWEHCCTKRGTAARRRRT